MITVKEILEKFDVDEETFYMYGLEPNETWACALRDVAFEANTISVDDIAELLLSGIELRATQAAENGKFYVEIDEDFERLELEENQRQFPIIEDVQEQTLEKTRELKYYSENFGITEKYDTKSSVIYHIKGKFYWDQPHINIMFETYGD